ncbi:MAG: STAS domain-containing protein [Spirochaetes bacterium]|nr:STAS domain-containing protein [Spirochaetota bacterium]
MKQVEFEMIDNIIILHLEGDMNSCGIMNVESVLDEIMERNPITIAVDCGRLLVLDSVTVSQLTKYLKKAKSNNIELVLYNINPEVLMTITLMQVDGLFTLVTEEQFERRYINKEMLN